MAILWNYVQFNKMSYYRTWWFRGNVLGLYFGGARIKSQSGFRLSWPKFSVVFPSPSRKIPEELLLSGKERFFWILFNLPVILPADAIDPQHSKRHYRNHKKKGSAFGYMLCCLIVWFFLAVREEPRSILGGPRPRFPLLHVPVWTVKTTERIPLRTEGFLLRNIQRKGNVHTSFIIQDYYKWWTAP